MNRPSDLIIVSRRIDVNLLPYLKENHIWNTDGAILTHFINAFQSLFPQGERVFIDAVRDCTEQNPLQIQQDLTLTSDLNSFIEQEGRHSVIHDKWTKALAATGYPTMITYDRQLQRFRTWARSHLDKMTRLSMTIGAEQYTASLAKLFAHYKPEIVFHSAPLFQKIFLYHAMEELEHKSVCFDLYRTMRGGYLRRIAGMAFMTYYIWTNILRRHRYLLRQDGKWNRKQRQEFWRFYLGPQGMIRIQLPTILEYIKPRFYPWQSDGRENFEERFGQLRTSFGITGFQWRGVEENRPNENAEVETKHEEELTL
jgi:predicted metal-dependent hydrolase